MFILRHQPDLTYLGMHITLLHCSLSHFLKIVISRNLPDFYPLFAFAAGYERLARARLGLPEVGVSEDPKYNQTPSSVLEIDQPSSVLEMELGPSTANISTATAAINDDDNNLDMFGDDDNDDANTGSGLNPGTSDVKSKFTSLALVYLLWKPVAHSPLFLATVVFSLFTNIFSFFLQKPIMEAWTQTMSMILLQGRLQLFLCCFS